MRILPLLGAFALLSLTGRASDLTLDGVTTLSVPYGESLLVEVTGSPGLPATLWGDKGPGPVLIAGEWVPLDLSPALFPVISGATGPSGVWSQPLPTPQDPSLAGITVHLAAVVWDPSDPNGADVSNGAVVALVPPVGAGAEQSTEVGQRVTLDGSSIALPGGVVPPGTGVFWEVTSWPPGSVAPLEGPDTLFPTLVPDVPGTYTVRVTATAKGAVVQAETRVHAYELVLTPPIEGRFFPSGSATFGGELRGPAGASLALDGAPLVLDGAGLFGPVTVDFDTSVPHAGVFFGLSGADGSGLNLRRTVVVGAPEWLDFGAPSSAVAHLEAGGLAEVASGLETSLEGTDLAPFLVDLPPTLVANEERLFGFTMFSATIDFTSMTWDPDMQVSMWPTPGGVDVLVRLSNVTTYFDVWGELLEVDYSLDGDSSSSQVDVFATLRLSAPGGELQVQVLDTDVQLSGFTFDLNGFLGDLAQLVILESWVKAQTIGVMEAELGAQIGPTVNALLSAFEFVLDLEPTLEVDATVATTFVDVLHTSHGVSLTLDADVAVGSAPPGAPNVAAYFATPSVPPVLGTSAPSGSAYAGALAASDDFLNLILAGMTRAGLLEGDLATLFPADPGQPASVLTIEVMDVLFPGAGFGLFPGGTPVELIASGSVAPVVVPTPAGPADARLHLGGLEVELRVTQAGAPLPVLRLVLDGWADVDLAALPDGTLSAVLVGSSFGPTVLKGFPGATLTSLQAGSEFLVQILVPQLTETLGAIPLPSLDQEGVTLTTDEVGPLGSPPEFLGFFGGMTYSPPPL